MTAPTLQSPPWPLPRLVVHADWSRDAKKRWMARAVLRDRCYHLSKPELVGDCASLMKRLRADLRPNDCVFIGFDFPIGLPQPYATAANLSDFLSALPSFGQGTWSHFYQVARTAADISIHRPFYPYASGGKRMAHLVSGLQLQNKEDLLRQCERQTRTRPAASPLFWTLGAKQVGKGAIAGWSEVLSPLLRESNGSVAIWPFSGDLASLFKKFPLVVAETYPAEAYRHLGLSAARWSKRSQPGRHARGTEIKVWAAQRPVVLDSQAVAEIDGGFGPSKDGEDPFDAFVGVCSMLDVALGYRSDGAPKHASVRKIEGWILGQQP